MGQSPPHRPLPCASSHPAAASLLTLRHATRGNPLPHVPPPQGWHVFFFQWSFCAVGGAGGVGVVGGVEGGVEGRAECPAPPHPI